MTAAHVIPPSAIRPAPTPAPARKKANPGSVQAETVRTVLAVFDDGDTFSPGDVSTLMPQASNSGVGQALHRWAARELMHDAKIATAGASLLRSGKAHNPRYTLCRYGSAPAGKPAAPKAPKAEQPNPPQAPDPAWSPELPESVTVVTRQRDVYLLSIGQKLYRAVPFDLTGGAL